MRAIVYVLMTAVALGAHSGEARSEKATISADPQATSATYGDWILLCQRVGDEAASRICEVAQSVQVQGQPGPIARLAIGLTKEEPQPRLTVVLPTNVLLTEQPKASIDEADAQSVALSWVRCLPGGCFADAELENGVLETWRSASERGRLDFTDGAGRVISVPFSFNGLAPAFDALKKE